MPEFDSQSALANYISIVHSRLLTWSWIGGAKAGLKQASVFPEVPQEGLGQSRWT